MRLASAPTAWIIQAVGATALVAGLWFGIAALASSPPAGDAPALQPALPAGSEPDTDRPAGSTPSTPSAEGAQVASPAVVSIPSIGVEAPIIGLDLRGDGTIDVPRNPDDAGWWRDGPEPGEPGPAVVYGHVDSSPGPAVFFRLEELSSGDLIEIERADGTRVLFTVDRIGQYAKDEFPTDDVYGHQPEPVLRLVTCGGEFDRTERSYRDNVVVYAHLVSDSNRSDARP